MGVNWCDNGLTTFPQVPCCIIPSLNWRTVDLLFNIWSCVAWSCNTRRYGTGKCRSMGNRATIAASPAPHYAPTIIKSDADCGLELYQFAPYLFNDTIAVWYAACSRWMRIGLGPMLHTLHKNQKNYSQSGVRPMTDSKRISEKTWKSQSPFVSLC